MYWTLLKKFDSLISSWNIWNFCDTKIKFYPLQNQMKCFIHWNITILPKTNDSNVTSIPHFVIDPSGWGLLQSINALGNGHWFRNIHDEDEPLILRPVRFTKMDELSLWNVLLIACKYNLNTLNKVFGCCSSGRGFTPLKSSLLMMTSQVDL